MQTRRQLGSTRETRSPEAEPARIPEIRVIRSAAIRLDELSFEPQVEVAVDDVGTFIDHLGRENRSRGTATALGSVAVTLLSEQEVQMVVTNTYRLTDRKKLLSIRRGLASSLRQFVHSREADKRYERARELPALMAGRASGYDTTRTVTYSPLRDLWTPVDDNDDPGDAPNRMSSRTAFELSQHPYGVQIADIGGVEMVEPKRWAFMLGGDVLAQERSELLRFLRRDEKLDTRAIDREFNSHATIFRTRPDLPDATPLQFTEAVPAKLALLPVSMG